MYPVLISGLNSCRADESGYFDGAFFSKDKEVAEFVEGIRSRIRPVSDAILQWLYLNVTESYKVRSYNLWLFEHKTKLENLMHKLKQ